MATTITITITITRVFYARYLHPAIAVMIMTTKRKRAVRRRLPSSPLSSSYMMYLVSMEMIMTTKRTVRTARTVMTTACVSQESWTAGSQCFSDSCLFHCWGLWSFLACLIIAIMMMMILACLMMGDNCHYDDTWWWFLPVWLIGDNCHYDDTWLCICQKVFVKSPDLDIWW